MKHFDITYFHGPFPDFILREDVIADIAASGITLVPLHYRTVINKQALALLRRYGLRAVVQDPRITQVCHSGDLSAAASAAYEVARDYAGFDNIIGWDITDEPHASKFPILAAIVNAFRRYSPQKETVINLFPDYASPEQLGNPDYRSHLEAFVNTVHPHLLSYDYYHFCGREARNNTLNFDVDERERLIRLAAESNDDRDGFFANMAVIRETAKKYSIDPMLIVLLTEHGCYRNLTRAELFWEVNMCLAYGMKRISYFTYWEPAEDAHWQWRNAMCDTKGNKMPHYFDVQAINAVISPIGHLLFETESKAVFHIGTPEKGGEAFSSFGGITGIDGEGGVIGFFEDGSVYLVNRDYIRENTFILHTDRPLTVFDGSCFRPAERTVFRLAAGEGVLLKL